jgi:hypothetical protein
MSLGYTRFAPQLDFFHNFQNKLVQFSQLSQHSHHKILNTHKMLNNHIQDCISQDFLKKIRLHKNVVAIFNLVQTKIIAQHPESEMLICTTFQHSIKPQNFQTHVHLVFEKTFVELRSLPWLSTSPPGIPITCPFDILTEHHRPMR